MTTGSNDQHDDGIVSADLAAADLISLTYVSDSRIPPAEAVAEIATIVARARERNDRLQVTGGLLFTGDRFVQTLEGDGPTIAALVAIIARDRRHDGFCVIDARAIAVRQYARWSLGYSGASLFVDDAVTRGLAGFRRGLPHDVARLLRLVLTFSRATPRPPA